MSNVSGKPTRRTYLVVDDHAAFRRTIRDFLPGGERVIVECSDGSQALQAYADLKPDWTIMDIEMGEVNGLSAAREIRSLFPDARIIILTQHDLQDFREEASAMGMNAFLSKSELPQLRSILGQFDPETEATPPQPEDCEGPVL